MPPISINIYLNPPLQPSPLLATQSQRAYAMGRTSELFPGTGPGAPGKSLRVRM
jgi:hypothetical protein